VTDAAPCRRAKGRGREPQLPIKDDATSVIDQDRREPVPGQTMRSPSGEIDLVRTGPGTPSGRFLRRFWVAIRRSEDLAAGQARPIRSGS
jgi:hypothetical protein